jgi:hypothetical protein
MNPYPFIKARPPCQFGRGRLRPEAARAARAMMGPVPDLDIWRLMSSIAPHSQLICRVAPAHLDKSGREGAVAGASGDFAEHPRSENKFR